MEIKESVTASPGPQKAGPDICEESHAGLCQELSDEKIEELAEFFKMFGDSTRLRILLTLSEGEINVQGLEEKLGMSQSAISHQLRLLKRLRLVKGRREGQYIYYSLDDEHVSSVLLKGLNHVLE